MRLKFLNYMQDNMREKILDESYWQNRYESAETGWDAGAITTPLKNYFDQLTNKDMDILIPGGGNSHEAEYLFNLGFRNITVIDIAQAPLENLKRRVPAFPTIHLLHQNFFDHSGKYDLIVEQTFFCALDPALRANYAKKMLELLKPGGKLSGLLFDDPLQDRNPPPFGGSMDEYRTYFEPYFRFKVFESSYNSIPPRKGKELFMILLRND